MKRTEEKTLLGLRIPNWLKEELREIAQKSERTITQQVLFILKAWVSDQREKTSK